MKKYHLHDDMIDAYMYSVQSKRWQTWFKNKPFYFRWWFFIKRWVKRKLR